MGYVTYRRAKYDPGPERVTIFEDPTTDYSLGDPQGVEYRVFDPDWSEREEEIFANARNAADTLRCIPVALCEPFKVRVITRGEANAYHVARCWQRSMHRVLSHQDPFRLTQGPLTQENLQNMLDKAIFPGTHEGFWVSGDYESATDNLNPDFCNIALEECMAALNIPWEDRGVLLKALSRHTIEWTGMSDRPDRDQNWGQLMGSPVSFPILCVLNASVMRLWYELILGKKVEVSALPMLINGDDVLFWCPSMQYYEFWKVCTGSFGLKPSLGKNYVSNRFLVINSQLASVKRVVDFYGRQTWTVNEMVPTLNLGLLYGTAKSGSAHEAEKSLFGTHQCQMDSLRQRAEDFIGGFPSLRDEMMSVWIKYWTPVLNKFPQGMSWFIHPSLGGIGLPVTREVTITDRQRKLAGKILLDSSPDGARLLQGISMPLPAFVDCFSRELSDRYKKLGAKFVEDGREDDSSWGQLNHYLSHGFDETDPEGFSRFVLSWNRLWKSSARHWADPLSFRKCVAGLSRPKGLDGTILYPPS